ncbi:hypothetical protein SAMN05216353_1461 [Halobacillus alkaliphilus]|uniref:Uncharacterized protein n=1 Tax=Halobacillus alkaliphilus TaxID=396056 RepID=A0A1I2S117_9BACI|nr:hypothetical protein [Halobacillus alkaliphilus]SFG46615.1 hypothetical protein SAMN05216353_1461 [Halobacillus alkaliphilus]
MVKRVAIWSVIILLFTLSILVYNNQQLPQPSDVLNSTKNLTNQPYNVLTIENINGDWVTFFKNEKAMYVGFLQQNWLGNWRVVNGSGDYGFLGDAAYNPTQEERNGLVWGASGLSKGNEPLYSYYYGMVLNPEVDEILLSTGKGGSEAVPLIQSDKEGTRFFFIKRKAEPIVPFELKALLDGKIIATEN